MHPGAIEVCNGIDDDCDGVVPPDELDDDSDGLLPCSGCAGLVLAPNVTGCDDCAPDNASQGTCYTIYQVVSRAPISLDSIWG